MTAGRPKALAAWTQLNDRQRERSRAPELDQEAEAGHRRAAARVEFGLSTSRTRHTTVTCSV